MIKDFNKFINEGYIHSFDDTFISTITKSIDIDIEYDEERYEYVDKSEIKIEWKLKMEVQKDGIYDFYCEGVKAVAEVTYLLNEHPDPEVAKSQKGMKKFGVDFDYEEEDFLEVKTYNIEAANIEYEKAGTVTQLIIGEVDLKLKGDVPKLNFRLVYTY